MAIMQYDSAKTAEMIQNAIHRRHAFYRKLLPLNGGLSIQKATVNLKSMIAYICLRARRPCTGASSK